MLGARATVANLIFLALACHSAFASDPTTIVTAENKASAEAAAPPPISAPANFEMDEKLTPRVRFWVDIYAKYHSWEAVITDVRYPQLVFGVVDTRNTGGSAGHEKRKVANMLVRLAAKAAELKAGKIQRSSFNPHELQMLELFERENLLGELPAIAADARRLRAQNGLRDALEDSLFASGKYLPRMKALFSRFHLPEEIAYLPFVESGFNKHAVSKVGASGIWQFMPYTGKLFLRVDEVVDERNDPMRAAEAAARLMKQNYDTLGEWPLAITAYNHGTAGMAKAARDVGTKNISVIIEKFESKTFGFASQNFYASFLAALHVAKNSEAYLGVVPRAKKLEFDEFVMPDFMALRDFIDKMSVDETIFRELNPALTEAVYKGEKYIPVGYNVRVPVEASLGFLGRYEAIPAAFKFKMQKEMDAPATLPAEAGRMPASVDIPVISLP